MAAPPCRSSRRVLSLPQRQLLLGNPHHGVGGVPLDILLLIDPEILIDLFKGKAFGEIDSFEEKKKTERIKIETSPSQEYQKTIF